MKRFWSWVISSQLSLNVRSTSQLNNIHLDSVLTTADAMTLKLIPFTVHMTYYLDSAIMNDPRYEYDFTYLYQVNPISSNSIKHQLTIQPCTSMAAFFGIALMINNNLFDADRNAFIANSALTPNDYILQKFKIGDLAQGASTLMNLQGSYGNFGTSFDHKCILGIEKIKFTRLMQYQFHMQNNLYGNYQSYTQSLTTPSKIPQSTNSFFCHGYNVECSDSTPYFDWIDGGCYTKSTCPLPIPNAMPYLYRCSWCIQFICQTCNPLNHAECITCAPSTNSFLNTGTKKCQCNPGFFPVYIDLAPHNFLGATHSLFSCTQNCSEAMKGCVHDKCTSQNYCSQCMTGYLLTPSGFNQHCRPCDYYLVKCSQCSNTQYCTVCKDGYYLYNVMHHPPSPGTSYVVGRACTPCLSHCKSCTHSSSCSQCEKGYKLQSSNTVCKCDPTQSALQNCQSCNVNASCATCNSGYFLSPTSGLCIHCIANHIGCKTCNNQNTCTGCIDGYALINFGTKTLCEVCYININYCNRCNNLNTCLQCFPPFGLENPSTCTLCSVINCVGCIQCFDAVSPCTKCNSLSFLINGSCFFCQTVHPNCQTCQINPTYQDLDCIQCKPGFYVHFNPVTNTQQCLLCIDAIHKCLQCHNETSCKKCQYPNSLSSNNLCEDCDPNFVNYNGRCMSQAGCMSIYQHTPENQTCLACQENLHYNYQQNHHLCECQNGYLQTIDLVSQRKCVTICGDGILIEPEQECDDRNNHDHDGCNSNCHVETNFKCSKSSPSKCVMYLNFNKFDFVYIERVLSENKGIMHFLIEPPEVGLSTVNWSKIISFNFSSTVVNLSEITYRYIVEREQLLVTVPYSEDLQTQDIKYTVMLDPDMIVSQTTFFTSTEKLIGINAPLIIEDVFLLSTCRILGIISLVLSVLALVQFYVGSYMNKMIGLETIQIIQLTFFIRVVVSHKNTSIMNCLNSLKYCATGYSNPQAIFGTIGMKKNQQILHEFLEIGIEKYFLMNVNFWLIPVILAIIIYLLLMIRRQGQKKNFLQEKQTESRQKFIKIHRSLSWIYNHFVFPQVMMFAMIVHFSIILSLNLQEDYQKNKISKIYMQSIGSAMFLQFGIYAIFTFQIFQSINSLLHPFRQLPLSLLQKLQLDEQSPDRPNYYPFYPFGYLIFNFIQTLIISVGVQVENFNYAIETVLILNILYLILINRWKPYFKGVDIHNKILKFNHIVAIVCLLIYEIIHRTSPLDSSLYIILISIVLVFIFLLIIGGFYRAYKQNQYRKKITFSTKNRLPKDSDLFDDLNNKRLTKKQRKLALLQKNPYAFKNQLEELKKSYNINKGYSQNKKLTQEDQKQIIQKIREQFKEKNNFYSDLIGNNHNLSFQDGLINLLTCNEKERTNFESKKSNNFQQVDQQNNSINLTKQKNINLKSKKANNLQNQNQKESLQRLKNRLKAQWSYMQVF